MVALLSNYVRQAESIIINADPDTLLGPLFLSAKSLSTPHEIENDSSIKVPLSFAIGGVLFIQLSCADKDAIVELLKTKEAGPN